MPKAGCWGRAERMGATRRKLKATTMTSQRKRLQSYLKGRGLEVQESDGARAMAVQNAWGGLNAPDLMDRVLDRSNFDEAVRRVVANRGAPGVDGMSASELPVFVEHHWDGIYSDLRTGRYKPFPVRRVEIQKPDGGVRDLGVPTVLDRAVQQAIAQALAPIYESKFSDRSYGFRPGRNAHQALAELRQDYADGCEWAVDIDLSKYFDTLNHELLMNILRRDIHDETSLVAIKAFLKSGVMVDGLIQDTDRGSPQGGNLSPLLANIYLNEFDRLLESRGHRFVRYADDIMILVRSRSVAERVMSSSVEFLEGTMKLKVNREKSSVAKPTELKFLGFTIGDAVRNGERTVSLLIHPKSLKRFRDRVRHILRERSQYTVEQTLRAFTVYLRGWLGYFAIGLAKRTIERLAGWARRRLRARLWHDWKTSKNRYRNLLRIGYKNPWNAANCLIHARSHGSWHMSAYRPLMAVLSNRYLEFLGFPKVLEMYDGLRSAHANRRVREVRTVV